MANQSNADLARNGLEAQGEYVVKANAGTGWFAVFLSTWQERIEAARQHGRAGPNLVVYRTRSENPRDHYVIPYSLIDDLLVDETITHSEINGSQRWNLTLKNNRLHVSHRNRSIDVSQYHGVALLLEDLEAEIGEEGREEVGAEEGRILFRLHRMRERDPDLVRRKKKTTLGVSGRLSCEVCMFDFATVYGTLGDGFAECHHRIPLSDLAGETMTRLADLAVVCSNCHRMLHRRPAHTVEQLRAVVQEGRAVRAEG